MNSKPFVTGIEKSAGILSGAAKLLGGAAIGLGKGAVKASGGGIVGGINAALTGLGTYSDAKDMAAKLKAARQGLA